MHSHICSHNGSNSESWLNAIKIKKIVRRKSKLRILYRKTTTVWLHINEFECCRDGKHIRAKITTDKMHRPNVYNSERHGTLHVPEHIVFNCHTADDDRARLIQQQSFRSRTISKSGDGACPKLPSTARTILLLHIGWMAVLGSAANIKLEFSRWVVLKQSIRTEMYCGWSEILSQILW